MHITPEVLTALITGIFSVITIAEKIYFEKKYNKKQKENAVSLVSHPLFVKIEVLKNHIQIFFTVSNKGKEAIFKDILYNFLTILKDIQYNFAKNIENNENINNQKLYNTSIEAFKNLIYKVNTYYMNKQGYNEQDMEALKIVLKKFDMITSKKISFLQDTIQSICTSPFYCSVRIKSAAILDLYLAVCIEIINNATTTLSNLNGDLKGLTFKGIKF